QIHATVQDSVVAGSAFDGITANSPGGILKAIVDRTSVVNNGNTGVYVEGQSSTNFIVAVSRSTITGNAVGWTFTTGANLVSYLNNNVRFNDNDGSPFATMAEQ